MANQQIPNLPTAISLSGAEQLEVVQAGVSRRTTTQQVADLKGIGPTGPTGTGPTGPTGPTSSVAGPTGATGPTGAASNVAGPTGPTGPTGAASSVAGPTGPTGAASSVAGPTGPTGAASSVAGPTGPTGATPAIGGTNTQVQYNSSGSFAGSSNFVFDGTNVGIGTTSPGRKLDIEQASTDYQMRIGDAGGNYYDIGRNTGNGLLTFNGNQAAASGYVFSTVNGERMRIDSSGNVGIGATAASGYRLQTNGNFPGIGIQTNQADGGTGGGWLDFLTTGGVVQSNIYWNQASGYMSFGTNVSGSAQVERMRIDSSGNLLVGTTNGSSATTSGVAIKPNDFNEFRRDNAYVMGIFITNANTGPFVEFRQNGSVRGTISTDGSTTAYNTSSDYRLKENVTPINDGLSVVSLLNPVRYDWKENGTPGEGFIAHELQAVIPHAVTGEKDAVNEDGSIKPQGVDYSKIVVHLVAAMQEQQAQIEDLKARLSKLETV
jgi:hypothetical protein